MNFYFVYVSSLPTNQLLYKELENYFRKSRAPLHKKYKSRISRIYTVRQPVNFRKAKNTFLFFHGTKAQNVGNILLEGLTIDPPNVKRTGAMFGQGLYFADRVSTRQLNIASQQVNTLSGFIFGCEVAVGKQFHASKGDPNLPKSLPRGKSTTIGMGRCIPSHTEKSII